MHNPDNPDLAFNKQVFLRHVQQSTASSEDWLGFFKAIYTNQNNPSVCHDLIETALTLVTQSGYRYVPMLDLAGVILTCGDGEQVKRFFAWQHEQLERLG